MIFSDAILNNKEIKLFNFGKSLRDFTYIDDVVESIYRCLLKLPNKNNNPKIKSDNTSSLFKIFNVGNSSPVLTADFVNILEKKFKKEAKKIFLPLEAGDVDNTFSCCESLRNWIDFSPATSLEKGLDKFVFWYSNYLFFVIVRIYRFCRFAF